MKLHSKGGLDWTWRFAWIVEIAAKIKSSRFVIDGEICVLDVDFIEGQIGRKIRQQLPLL